MTRLLLCILFLSPFFAAAQNYENSWHGHFSYVTVKDISHGNNKIHVASENAIFTYDLSTNTIKTLSTINGLSGEYISAMHYSSEFGLLIIGYETGLIEIAKDGQENVLKVVDVLSKQTIPPNKKRINHFYEYEGKVYISTQYGISVYNLAALEFGDTYFIGDGASQIEIEQITVQEPYIFAASKDAGIKRAVVADDNLIDYQNWSTIITGSFRAMEQLGPDLYAATQANNVVRFTPSGSTVNVANFNSEVQSFKLADELLTITTKNAIQTYSSGFVREAFVNNLPEYNLDLQTGYAFANNLYLGTKDDGLLIVPFNNNNATQILPNGPIKNSPFSIDVTPGQAWVSFGDLDINYNPFNTLPSKYGVSHLSDTLWSNISYQELSSAVGAEPSHLVKVTINPKSPEQVYMSSFQNGLLKIIDETPSILYDETNSPLDRLGEAGIRIFGSEFDSQGNLWFLQSKADKGIIKLSPNGQFTRTDISGFIDAQAEVGLAKIAISREGYIFIGSYKNGVIGYNPQTNKFNKIVASPGSGNLPSENVRALAIDNQNRLWIGTLKGLRVIYSPGSFFEGGAVPDSQPIIILENDVAQELLYEQSITAIKVDGSNNKWIATSTSGVFHVSPDGQKILHRFTSDNSPLPSNNVQDIAIDPASGVVYFATLRGLVAYRGTATAPGENLENLRAFPNPVRPGFSGNVTIDGLTAKANVKITDITGSLVFETTSEGGSVLWDTSAFGKYKVRSGVYLVLVTTQDYMETKVAKIMIIR